MGSILRSFRLLPNVMKDYEIVSPECGELRILRHNSGRHDSTSMIFGRQITAVEAEVKYKFWLRGGSVRHQIPTVQLKSRRASMVLCAEKHMLVAPVEPDELVSLTLSPSPDFVFPLA
ncbi:hypothetical protein Bbelb_003640 [Branchiostoma belcheri]|nr:hypothetical protein Bbelb_003640 [Branchiostoma belcheri]